jgi:hypothetical protein
MYVFVLCSCSYGYNKHIYIHTHITIHINYQNSYSGQRSRQNAFIYIFNQTVIIGQILYFYIASKQDPANQME